MSNMLISAMMPRTGHANDFIIYVDNKNQNNQAGTNPEVVGEKAKLGISDEMINSIKESIKKGDVVDLSDRFKFEDEPTVTPDGKTIVENKRPGSITLEDRTTNGPDDANRAAANGEPTHGFFYRDMDFLFEAAKKYATLGDNEVFRFRDIDDVNFIQDTLDFFTGGNYTHEDTAKMEEQITDVVFELAKQIKEGKEPDLNKLQTKLTIKGADVTISELMGFQKVGREISSVMNKTSTAGIMTDNFAKIGLAKALGNKYGNDRGEIGKLFSSRVDDLYQKSMNKIKQNIARKDYEERPYWHQSAKDGVKTGMQIADMFSKLDISSIDNMKKDFAEKLSTTRSMVQDYCNRNGLQTSWVGLAGDTAEITKFFNQWMNAIS